MWSSHKGEQKETAEMKKLSSGLFGTVYKKTEENVFKVIDGRKHPVKRHTILL
ncbi:hypothetical protein Lsan_0863 [Legionella santicrucis]|uniref:Uncharacterized protein n=1 Tax=Legionella santicrucis TaxID=45074 RepID=A0A0W0Z7X0_9GAMM|nr:hypothetical protein [Legionella santicrucis]KTD65188.1 hypothetical protein Lsan_0863 [Legionella santicrucis]